MLVCDGCTACCGIVPVSEKEMKAIQKELRRKSKYTIDRLKNQKREALECMFVDKDKQRCAIYKVRPNICRNYGYVKGLECPYQPDKANKPYQGKKEEPIGLLGMTITWDNINDYK